MSLPVIAAGEGPPVVIVGGALRSAESYRDLATCLANRGWGARVPQRRGRHGSPPRVPGAGIEREIDDLADVCAREGAVAVFGHSFGGLIALEAAARGAIALPLAVYEPGVSVGGSLPATWVEPYLRLLERGRRRRAFSYFVQHSPGSPAIARHAPLWYLDLVLRAALRRHWAGLDPLLEASADEHLIVASCDDRVPAYAAIAQPVLLLGGAKSPPALVGTPFPCLAASLPEVDVRVLAGLDHFAPDDKAPNRVADEMDAFLRKVPVQGV